MLTSTCRNTHHIFFLPFEGLHRCPVPVVEYGSHRWEEYCGALQSDSCGCECGQSELPSGLIGNVLNDHEPWTMEPPCTWVCDFLLRTCANKVKSKRLIMMKDLMNLIATWNWMVFSSEKYREKSVKWSGSTFRVKLLSWVLFSFLTRYATATCILLLFWLLVFLLHELNCI